MPDDRLKMAPPADSGAGAAHVSPPRIAQKIFKETHPIAQEKDKSLHSEHGVIHYPFYYGGLASCVSLLCTQPLGVGE